MARHRCDRSPKTLVPGATFDDAAVRAEELRARVEALTIRFADGHLPRAASPPSPEFGGNLMMDKLKLADGELYRAKNRPQARRTLDHCRSR